MNGEVLTLKKVCKYYTGGQNVVMGLNSIDLSFRCGEFVAVTGESGSGKSTLAHVISGIMPYESGEMLLRGKPTSHYDSSDWERHRRENISFVSQNYGILPGSTVLENVVSALRIVGMEKTDAEDKARKLLELVELWELRSRRSAKLSSGQKQRLAIARALAKPAPILVADEPTGNLDPENSAKVISLLAKAAEERLVILITHDFHEVKDYATRHIQLQDGRVTMDAALREAAVSQPRQEGTVGKRKSLSPYIAALQIRSRPVWAALVLLFFAMTAFAVFAFLGTFIVNLDDTPTRVYDSSAFLNGTRTRIVVQRPDGAPMEQGDLDALLAVEQVESLERSGYVTDVNYAWRENVDYTFHYSVKNEGSGDSPEYRSGSSVELLPGMAFLRTVPVFADGRSLVTEGREPENMYEVVLAGSADRIGEVIPVYIRDVKNWNLISYVRVDVEVVGVTDYGTGLFFDEELGRVFTNYQMTQGKAYNTFLVAPVYGPYAVFPASVLQTQGDDYTAWPEGTYREVTGGNGEVLVECYLPEGECALSAEAFGTFANLNRRYGQRRTLAYYNFNENSGVMEDYDNYQQFWISGAHSSPCNDLVLLNPADFDRLALKDASNQISLFITDYAYTQRVLDDIQAMGYTAVSPYQQGSTEKDPLLAAQRMQTLTVCCGALAAVVLLMAILLRVLFGMQLDSYRLLSNMGLGCGRAKKSILWQVLALTAAGQVLGILGILICRGAGVERIVSIMRYLPLGYWLLLSGVHLAVSLLGALWIMGGIARQVYPLSSKRGDLEFEEAAV